MPAGPVKPWHAVAVPHEDIRESRLERDKGSGVIFG